MINAILNQKYKQFEYIIVDNGSDDGSAEVLERFAKQDERISIYSIEKSSIAKGRKIGLEMARGEYITYVDDDDWVTDDYLNLLVENADKYDADIVYCGSDKEINGEIYDNLLPCRNEVLDGGQALIKMLQRKECNAGLPAKLIRRSCIELDWFPNDSMHEDIYVTYKIFANAKKVVARNEKNYRCNRDGQNTSAFTTNDRLLSPEQLDEYFGAFAERSAYIAKVRPEMADFGKYTEWSYMISMCNKIEKNKLTNCSRQLEYVKKELTIHFDEFYNSPYIEDFEKEWMDCWVRKNG